MYDFLFVGAGLSSASSCAVLKEKYNICVIDTRQHIGGNCYDYYNNGYYIHNYGPHFFHTKNTEIVKFLSKYTEWIEYKHNVLAEVKINNEYKLLPFPYSKETEILLSRVMEDGEIIDTFFRGYSKKMWGIEWEQMPDVIKKRIPNRIDRSEYFPNQFTAIPKNGYTRMIENMFDGVDIILGCDSKEWKNIRSHNVVYCGRPDHLVSDIELSWRNLIIEKKIENFEYNSDVVNFCHTDVSYTRKFYPSKIYNKKSNIVLYETPTFCNFEYISPYYPMVTENSNNTYNKLIAKIKSMYDNLYLLGRLGEYRYMNMDECVSRSIKFSKRWI
jgi:UDP-galactopyranose mutase